MPYHASLSLRPACSARSTAVSDKIHADDPIAGPRQGPAVRAGATADVKRPLVPARMSGDESQNFWRHCSLIPGCIAYAIAPVPPGRRAGHG